MKDSEADPEIQLEQLRSILGLVPDVVYRLDTEGRITFVNEAVRQYGYTPEELIGTDVLDLVHPEDREKARYRIAERRTGDRSTRALEVRLLTGKGQPVPFEIKAGAGFGDCPRMVVTAEGLYSTEKPESKSWLGTQGIARDITDRQESARRSRMEQMVLRVSTRFVNVDETRLDEEINRALGEMVAFIGADGAWLGRFADDGTSYSITHLWCNDRLDIRIEEEQNRSLEGIKGTEYDPQIVEETPFRAQIIRDVAALPADAKLRIDLEGNRVGSVININDPAGDGSPVFMAVASASRGRDWEESEVHLFQLLGHVFINAMHRIVSQTAIHQASRLMALGEMAAGVAHELRQPLSGISATAEGMQLLLKRGKRIGEEQLLEDADLILEQTERMNYIIEHLRLFSRDGSREERAEIEVNSLIDGVLHLTGHQLRLHDIQVVQELGEDLPLVRGDRYRLEQALLNLLANARDAVDNLDSGGKRIALRTRLDAGRAVLEVEDNGPGIPEEVECKMFEPFYTTKGELGTGLGLSIVYAIVRDHEGEIECRSSKGQGTTLRIMLPCG